MLTRRQLLLSAAVVGLPVAAAVPLPAERHRLRLGLLHSRQPFIDVNDIAGSRERAFTAYRVLIRRSLDEQGQLDWLAGGAFSLSGPGPFPRPVLEQLALSEHSVEVESLKLLAKAHDISLTLGGWWRATGTDIAYRLLEFDSRGQCRAWLPGERAVSENVQLHMPAHRGLSSLSDFAAECGRLRRYGAWIEPLQGPPLPPGAPSTLRHGAIVGPDGELLAQARGQAESCLVAEV